MFELRTTLRAGQPAPRQHQDGGAVQNRQIAHPPQFVGVHCGDLLLAAATDPRMPWDGGQLDLDATRMAGSVGHVVAFPGSENFANIDFWQR